MGLLSDLILPDDLAGDRGYYELIESHLTYLRTHPTTSVKVIKLSDAAVYKGDFYGLLNYLGVDKKYHYPIMRVNGYGNAADYPGDVAEIIFPSEEVIGSIITIYQSTEVT